MYIQLNKETKKPNGNIFPALPAKYYFNAELSVDLTEANRIEFGYVTAKEYVAMLANANLNDFGYPDAETNSHQYALWLIESGLFLAHVTKAYDDYCKAQIAKYSETERLTWADQEKEALSYIADTNASTPTLDALCLHRGFDNAGKLALANRIVANAIALRAMASHGLGMVQACEDALKALDKETVTHAQVLALMPDFSVLSA